MNEPIDLALRISGVELDFNTFTVQALPGMAVIKIVDDFGSHNNVQTQLFSFQISEQDFLDNNIKLNDAFSMETDNFKFSFVINDEPIQDITGWVLINANLTASVAI